MEPGRREAAACASMRTVPRRALCCVDDQPPLLRLLPAWERGCGSASWRCRATSGSTCMPWKPPVPPASGSGGPPNSTASTGSSFPAANRPPSTSCPATFGLRDPLRRTHPGRPARLRLLRRDDPAGGRDRRPREGPRRQPAADVRRTRHHGAPQRLRPAARILRDGPGLQGPRIQRHRLRRGSRSMPSSSAAHGWSASAPGVEVLAQVEPADPEHASHAAALAGTARIVAVRSGKLLATSFHPEVTGEKRVHELFIRMIRGEA